jgi:hypothetical protein
VCREERTAENRYATVYKMVESTHRCCSTRKSIKPPKGALINSPSNERLGESSPKRLGGRIKGVESFDCAQDKLYRTMDEVSRSCYLQSKVTKYDKE